MIGVSAISATGTVMGLPAAMLASATVARLRIVDGRMLILQGYLILSMLLNQIEQMTYLRGKEDGLVLVDVDVVSRWAVVRKQACVDFESEINEISAVLFIYTIRERFGCAGTEGIPLHPFLQHLLQGLLKDCAVMYFFYP